MFKLGVLPGREEGDVGVPGRGELPPEVWILRREPGEVGAEWDDMDVSESCDLDLVRVRGMVKLFEGLKV